MAANCRFGREKKCRSNPYMNFITASTDLALEYIVNVMYYTSSFVTVGSADACFYR